MKNYIVIPDTHGQVQVVSEALAYIKTVLESDSYTVIFLGDYLDRGESGDYAGRYYDDHGSLTLFLLLKEFQKYCQDRGIEIIFLRGNHEEIFENFFRRGDRDMLGYPFFASTVEIFRSTGQDEALLAFIDSMKYYHHDQDQQLFFVHAGVDVHLSDPTQNEIQTLIWIRSDFFHNPYQQPFTVIFGHTPFEDIFTDKNRIGLDGGIYVDKPGYGKLNIMTIKEGEMTFKAFKNPGLKVNRAGA